MNKFCVRLGKTSILHKISSKRRKIERAENFLCTKRFIRKQKIKLETQKLKNSKKTIDKGKNTGMDILQFYGFKINLLVVMLAIWTNYPMQSVLNATVGNMIAFKKDSHHLRIIIKLIECDSTM